MTEAGVVDSERWISSRNRVAGSRLRLFCLPHAGSGTAAYVSWRRGLPEFVELCPILLPGREARIAEESWADSERLVDAISDALSRWMDKPYVIFGHSMGSLLAFELAMSLRDKYGREPEWLFLSGRIAAHLELPGRPIHQLSDEEFLAELDQRYEGLPKELLEDPEMLALFLPILRADITLIERYRHRVRRPLGCPVTVFGGVTDKSVSEESLRDWRAYTTGEFAVKRMPGGHFYLWGESRAQLLDEVCRRLMALDTGSAV